MSKQRQVGVEKVVEKVNNVLIRELEHIHRQLIESGLDPDKVNEAFGSYAPSSKKYGIRPSNNGEVTLILDYGPKSHALFGNVSSIKEAVRELSAYVRFNRNLSFGQGWVIRDKEKLKELQEVLKANNLRVKTISRKEYKDQLNVDKGPPEEDIQKTDKNIRISSK